ncbi:translation initiation factor IF-2 [Mycena sanguinolenta]|nr:translation initiation factor IF-2 [Mycena sanguinolenta]
MPHPPESPSNKLANHLRWRAPQLAPSHSTHPIDSASVLDTIDNLLPSLSTRPHQNPPPSRSSPQHTASTARPQLQRDQAPHLEPQGLEAKDKWARSGSPTDSQLQRDVAPHLDPQTLQPKEKWARTSTKPSTSSQPREPRSQAETQAQAPTQTQTHPAHSSAEFPIPEDILIAATPEIVSPSEAGSIDKQHRLKNAFKERGSWLKADAPKPVVETKTNALKVKKIRTFVEKRVDEDVYIPSTVSVGHLARLLSVKLEDLQDKMFQAGMGAQASFDYVLTSDYAVLLAEEFGRRPTVNDEAAFDLFPPPPHPNPDTLPNRPPVVTIMGHVDHGKTTLLDSLRSSSVAAGEVGGITQHIGAFSVPVSSTSGPQSITFLDTPGHAAFSAMRARGAQVTDIIVLVVAADDGVMPQTREVIELIKKDREKVGAVVAINKVDKPGSNVDAVQKALLVEDIHLEEFGGDIPSVEVSGLTGKGLPDLVETISLISEIQDLRAEPEGNVFGYVLESKVVKGLGSIATVLVLRGCLKPGSHILSGLHHAKVRLMHDSNGKMVKTASPGLAVTVSGWKSLPNAGDEVLQGTESEIKRAIVNRQRKADIEASLVDLEAINATRQQERDRRQAEADAEATGEEVESAKHKDEEPAGPKELRLLIKADVSGSAEAVEGALQGIGNHLAMSKVLSSGVGAILESDVMMAKTVGATIVGFSVPCSRAVELLASQNSVPIIRSDIIYRLMEDVKARVIGLLPTTTESRVTGEAKVLQLFQITVKGKKLKTVAGSRIINGLVEKNKLARVVRNGDVVFEGSFETMRHFKKDVTELRKGTECGLNLAGFDELQVDDVIQTYETIEIPGVL